MCTKLTTVVSRVTFKVPELGWFFRDFPVNDNFSSLILRLSNLSFMDQNVPHSSAHSGHCTTPSGYGGGFAPSVSPTGGKPPDPQIEHSTTQFQEILEEQVPLDLPGIGLRGGIPPRSPPFMAPSGPVRGFAPCKIVCKLWLRHKLGFAQGHSGQFIG